MKRILITGTKGYLGTSLKQYLSQWPEYAVTSLSLREGQWEAFDFHGYDAVYHAAALVHQKKTKDDPTCLGEYRKINRDLTLRLAEKAKAAGVGQFLFLSTEAVYGLTAPYGKEIVIGAHTPTAPVDNYGISKLEAEQGLQELASDSFRVAILRPPLIYGKGCTGNFRALEKMADRLPCFPKIENRRSMLYVENLNALVKLLIDRQDSGLFCPQDPAPLCTSQVVRAIAQAKGKRLALVPGFGWALGLLGHVSGSVGKAFGSLRYDEALSRYPQPYQLVSFPESVFRSEI